MLPNIKISAHHGYINRENELGPTLDLLNSHPEIGMVEIDFVYSDGKFISAHDYEPDTIIKGSELSEWLDAIIPLRKIIWMDIKDSNWSILSNTLCVFDVGNFFNLLHIQKEKFTQTHIKLEHFIIISSQYESTRDKLCASNVDNFQLVCDMPLDYAYITKTILPSSLDHILDYFIQKCIDTDTKKIEQIICLDTSFFELDDLILLINKLTTNTIILYSLDIDQKLNLNISNKQIICQYDYYMI